MSRNNFYPEFVADQVLTAKQLNDLLNYLDGQDQLTRSSLIGIGIACGLDSSFNGKSIKIPKGTGVTSTGNLIRFSDGEYSHFRKYKLPDSLNSLNSLQPYNQFTMYELVDKESVKTGDKEIGASKQFLAEYAVALFLEKETEDLKNCLTDDCEDKGRKVSFTVKPVLIEKKDVKSFDFSGDKFSSQNLHPEFAKTLLPDVALQRLNVPFNSLKSGEELLDAFQKVVSPDVLKQIAEAYKLSFEIFRGVLELKSNPFEKLESVLAEMSKVAKGNQLIFTQYFYDFISDLIQAYDEFKETGLNTMSACLPDESLFPWHLSLGEATRSSQDGVEDYRNYFIFSPVLNNQKGEVGKLKMLFDRMALLVKSFKWPGDAKEIKITPSMGGKACLSQKAIPFYYDPSEIFRKWNFSKTKYGKETTNLSYHSGFYNKNSRLAFVENPLLYDIGHNDFFRIEGHIGKDLKAVYEELLKQRDVFNLPFNIVTLKMGDDASDIAIENSYYDDLESQFETNRKELLCFLGRLLCFLANQRLVVKREFFLLPTQVYYTQVQYFQPIMLQMTVDDKAKENQPQTGAETQYTIREGSMAAVTDFSKQENVLHAVDLMQMDAIRGFKDIPGRIIDILPFFPDLSKILVLRNGDFLKSQSCYKPWKEGDREMSMGQYYIYCIIGKKALPKEFGENQFPLKNVYVELIDKIEDLAALLRNTSLSTINATAFEAAWEMLRETARILLQNVEKNKEELKGASYAPDFTELTQNLHYILNRCDPESLKALKEELAGRILKIQKEGLFSNFAAKHPGFEHRAGVSVGGTFIMVYKKGSPLAGKASNLPDGKIIADFYLPYLCCNNGASGSVIQISFADNSKKEKETEEDKKPSEPEPKPDPKPKPEPEPEPIPKRPGLEDLLKLSPKEWELYSPDILVQLPVKNLEQLSPAKIGTFSPEIIQQMSVSTLETLEPITLEQLPVATLEKLSPAKIETLKPATIQQMSVGTLEKLSPKSLEQLPVATLEKLSPAKIETLKPATIQQMSVGTLEKLSPKSLEQLPVATLEKLSPKKIETLDVKIIEKMKPATIEKLDVKLLEKLDVTVLKTLDQSVLNRLNPNILRNIIRPPIR